MFDRIRRSANSTIEGIDVTRLRDAGASFVDADGPASQTAAHLAEQAKVAAGHARVAAADAAVQAKEAAILAKDWSAPRLEATKDWLTPRLEHAWAEGVKAAAPKIELAAEKATPAIGTAHDKLVDELLPRLVSAVNDAAERAGGAIEAAAGKAAAIDRAEADVYKPRAAENAVVAALRQRGRVFIFIAVSIQVCGGTLGARVERPINSVARCTAR